MKGRENLFPDLEKSISQGDKIIWFHCSSIGEFEQGKPVIDSLQKVYPSYKILVTFFSPSGYESVKKNSGYIVSYLPLDTRENAQKFLSIVQPSLVVFVKYEFWYHHLSAAAFRHIPILLISAVFRPDQFFFKRYGNFYFEMLFLFRHIFVQDEQSLSLLTRRNIHHVSIGGDTRFDRVLEIQSNNYTFPIIEQFISNKEVMVAGSTWPGDEDILASAKDSFPELKLIVAPHEINEDHIIKIERQFPNAQRYSVVAGENETEVSVWRETSDVLIIDSIGMLSRLYKYGTICFIGGGYTKDGIHNILEAAVFGKPVIFGPNYHKYREAKELLYKEGAFTVNTSDDLKDIMRKLLGNKTYRENVSSNSRNYVLENTGTTARILQFIQEKRLLTNS